MSRTMLIAGNWKMNGLQAALTELEAIAVAAREGPDLLICPPATLVSVAATKGVAIGGQTCHAAVSGAHTGEVSAEMLADAGAKAVILGHSERRADQGESDADVNARTLAVWKAEMIAIVCVGESEAQRDAGDALGVVMEQIRHSIPSSATGADTVVAYEPIWAIGTGRTPSVEDIADMHEAIRAQLVDQFGAEGADIRILYGGSLKPENAAEILAIENVDGGLVGGASLKAADFLAIANAAHDVGSQLD